MAIYPNGRYLTRSGSRMFGPGAGLEARSQSLGATRNRFVNASFARTASTPDGYDVRGMVPPVRAGSMSARNQLVGFSGVASLLNGAPMQGSGSITWAGSGGLSLIVSLSGSAAIVTFTTGAASLQLTLSLEGGGSFTLTGAGGLSMIVPFEGTGSISFTGLADLRGRLALEGSWTPFTALSPEGLAQAVWSALSASNNGVGTMGAKLNSAASGGVDLNALAAAVWSHTVRTLTTSGGLTTEQATQLREIFELQGLDPAKPLQVSQTQISAGAIDIEVSESGGAYTAQRQ